MTCSVPSYSQRLPCLGLKVLFVPTLAKAHPDPKLSRVRVRVSRGAGGAEQSHPSAQGLASAFCCSSGEADARPGPAALLGMASAGSGSRPCAVLVRARRRREQGAGGRQQDQGSTGVSALLMPVSLCFFDKNLKEERDAIRGMSRAGVGRC